MKNLLINTIQKTIKPCPCCGGKDVYFKILDEKKVIDGYAQDVTSKLDQYKTDLHLKEKVGCFTCGLNMVRAIGCQAINQWNTRVS